MTSTAAGTTVPTTAITHSGATWAGSLPLGGASPATDDGGNATDFGHSSFMLRVPKAPVPAPTIAVTGGAGYIGSHTARLLEQAGYKLVVIDNLSTGNRWAVPKSATFVEGDVGDIALMTQVLRDNNVSAIIHFAANTVVPESVGNPLKYYCNNTAGSVNLFRACMAAGVDKIVFSSTAAVYGTSAGQQASETSPTVPISPYGHSKLFTEQVLRDLATAGQAQYIAFRYFNVAGADPEGVIGQATPNATHLIKVASEAATGAQTEFNIFGTDYDTPDGTAVRDYIHVTDLAYAHVLGVQYLLGGGQSDTLNCGYGVGFSVRDVLTTMQGVSGQTFVIREMPRRQGDIPALIADPTRIHSVLGWQPTFNNLAIICRTAYNWERTWQQMQKSGVR